MGEHGDSHRPSITRASTALTTLVAPSTLVPMTQVVDYSFSRPAPQDIVDGGFQGALRYLAPLPNRKVVTADEISGLHAAGLQVGFVWETTAARALDGFDAGQVDAVAANQLADDLGVPDEVVLHFAVDTQATWDQVAPYFDGVRSVSKRAPRPYGCYDVIEGWGAATGGKGWQCAAWSGTGSGSGGSLQGRRLSQFAALYQLVGYVLGNTSDANEVLDDDWGGWPTPTPIPEDDEMAKFGTIRRPSDGAIFITMYEGGAGWPTRIVAHIQAGQLETMKAGYGVTEEVGDNESLVQSLLEAQKGYIG